MKKTKKHNVFYLYKTILKQILLISPMFFVLLQILGFLHGISWGLNTMFTQRFFDACTEFVGGNTVITSVFIGLASLGAAYLFCQLINGVHSLLLGVFAEKINGRLQIHLNNKINRLAPIDFEDTELLDMINKADSGKGTAISFVMDTANIVFSNLPFYLFMTWYLSSLKPILAVAIVIVFIPTILSQLLRAQLFTSVEEQSAPLRRESGHYEECMIGRGHMKETRLLGLFQFFMKRYIRLVKDIHKMSWKANLKNARLDFLMRAMTLIGYIAILYMLFNGVINGDLTPGVFAALISSVGGLFGLLEGMVCGQVVNISRNIGKVRNYVTFLNMKELDRRDVDYTGRADITLDSVDFQYPHNDRKVLKDINLTIREGETLALVGENGSGKSTLVRLIIGLYTPTNGCIKHGEYRTDEISTASLMKNTTGIFQNYQRYLMTLSENVSISDISKEKSDDKINQALKMTSIDPNSDTYPDGIDTLLSREFGGVDLSGGQWQRVAIARGLYRSHNIIVLDEPTAAIDPLEEKRLYQQFKNISQGKTAVLVTHRLGSVKLADRIVVLDDGCIIGVGTHNKLMHLCEKYNEMYQSQNYYDSKEHVYADSN